VELSLKRPLVLAQVAAPSEMLIAVGSHTADVYAGHQRGYAASRDGARELPLNSATTHEMAMTVTGEDQAQAGVGR
jgi:hypothetical protein